MMDWKKSEEKFLRQSYLDAWENYQFILANPDVETWDWVAVTASNERQADSFRRQIEKRREKGMLPENTQFVVVADIGGKRVGSGGATLSVIRHIVQCTGLDSLKRQKILVVHSGGDSKRIPQYSACGKLFSPIPRLLPNGECSALFDELLISVSRMPLRMSAGMLVLSGDTEMLFHPLQMELLSCDAAGMSIKASCSEGKEHGVFLAGEGNLVRRFLHKQPEDALRRAGATGAGDDVDIDTGCIWLGHRLVESLAGLFYLDGEYKEEKFLQFVNGQVRLSFYADFIPPLAECTSLEEYLAEKPEGEYSDALVQCRRELWDKLRPYRLALVRMAPAKYIHIGTTEELFCLMVYEIGSYRSLGWEKRIACSIGNTAGYCGVNSYVSHTVHLAKECYVENCILLGSTEVAPGTVLSGVVAEGVSVPGGVVLHGLKLRNGRYVCRIYGLEDNPKGSADSRFMGSSLRGFLRAANIDAREVWAEQPPSIWNAELYPECGTCREAVKMALVLYRIINGQANKEEVAQWKMSKRYSLESSFEEADSDAYLSFRDKIRQMVSAENCITKIQNGEDVRLVMDAFKEWDEGVLKRIEDFARKEAGLFLKARLYLGLSFICGKFQRGMGGCRKEQFANMAYGQVRKGIQESVFLHHKRGQAAFFSCEEVQERLPVRVNFCGSPSDAAPYCLEYGGTMLDAALLLRGEKPVMAAVRRTNELTVRFTSIDLKKEAVCTQLSEIQNCGNPYDTFALHKAVLLATAVFPMDGTEASLHELCEKMGGGMEVITEVDVAKGSGLGTSSILAAAAVRAVHKAMGEPADNDQVCAEVFLAEQLMNTGGGWQDQAGGMAPGIKLMRTSPGMYQKVCIDPVKLDKAAKKELQERFVLIFSGQRRLARNILREEMSRLAENNRLSLEAVEQVRKLCVLMKYELERGNITGFAEYMTEQFSLVKRLDEGASNTCIEYIFDCCEGLIDGKSVCGAGGGGFLQVILKKGTCKEKLRRRLQEVFKGCGVEVWDSEFLWD